MSNSTARIAKSQQRQRYYCTGDPYVAEETLEVALHCRSPDSPSFATSWASTPPLRAGCAEVGRGGPRRARRLKPNLRQRYLLSTSPVRVNPGAVSGHPLGQYLRTSSAPMPTSTTCRFVPHSGHGVALTRTRLDMVRGYPQVVRPSPHRCSSASCTRAGTAAGAHPEGGRACDRLG